MMTAKEIRDSFKNFFESKQHAIVPSAPMVVKDDPTLMFTKSWAPATPSRAAVPTRRNASG